MADIIDQLVRDARALLNAADEWQIAETARNNLRRTLAALASRSASDARAGGEGEVVVAGLSLIADPDYARIYTKARIVAWQHGYALAIHGSLSRDLDLVLIPWTEQAKSHSPEHVIRYMAQITETDIPHPPSDKPHGRRAWSLHLKGFNEVRWVDVSTVPLSAAPSQGEGADR